jgi:hypothetical protein
MEKVADQTNTLAGGVQKISQAVDGMKGQNETTTRYSEEPDDTQCDDERPARGRVECACPADVRFQRPPGGEDHG